MKDRTRVIKVYHMCHTSVSELTLYYEDNYDTNEPFLVKSLDTVKGVASKDQWFELKFDTAFAYNGEDNLIVEFNWESEEGEDFESYCTSYPSNQDPKRLVEGLLNETKALYFEPVVMHQRLYYSQPTNNDFLQNSKTLFRKDLKIRKLSNNRYDISYPLDRDARVTIKIYNITVRFI